MIYIIWSDHNGTYLEPFTDLNKAERRHFHLSRMENKDKYGTTVSATIEGKEITLPTKKGE